MQITLTFQQELNNSLQAGDTVWYVSSINIKQAGGYNVSKEEKITKLGTVVSTDNKLYKVVVSNSLSLIHI